MTTLTIRSGSDAQTVSTVGWLAGTGPSCLFCGQPAPWWKPANLEGARLWWCPPCETTWEDVVSENLDDVQGLVDEVQGRTEEFLVGWLTVCLRETGLTDATQGAGETLAFALAMLYEKCMIVPGDVGEIGGRELARNIDLFEATNDAEMREGSRRTLAPIRRQVRYWVFHQTGTGSPDEHPPIKGAEQHGQQRAG